MDESKIARNRIMEGNKANSFTNLMSEKGLCLWPRLLELKSHLHPHP